MEKVEQNDRKILYFSLILRYVGFENLVVEIVSTIFPQWIKKTLKHY